MWMFMPRALLKTMELLWCWGYGMSLPIPSRGLSQNHPQWETFDLSFPVTIALPRWAQFYGGKGCCTALVPSEHISLKGCYPGIRQPVGCVAKAWWKRDVFALLAGPAPSRRFFWPNFWVPGGLYHVVLAPAVVLAGCTQPELAVCSSQGKLGLETLAETERYVYGERATLPQ